MSKPGVTTVPEPSASSEGTLEALIDLLRREFEFGRDEIEPSSRLVEDLDLDSLDFVALATAIEEEWDCTLGPDESLKVGTVEDLVSLVEELRAPLEKRGGPRGCSSVG